ncbi:MAG TPA: response regulator [Phycisphaerae bacterium]|nr:response regulator [Phycisphaerae bacterium]
MSNELLAGRRILVVEDEMLVLMNVEYLLADLGCESVAAAATVDQALQLIEAQVFDAAVVDVNLNGHESYPVADALAARGVPFAFSTGYSDAGMKDEYRDRPILRKPYQQGGLAQILASLLAR